MLPGRIMVLLVCLGAILGFAGSMSRFPNGHRRARMCRFWDLETMLMEGGQRDGGQERGLFGIFTWAAFKKLCRQGFPAALVFSYIASLHLPAKDEKALANLENSVV